MPMKIDLPVVIKKILEMNAEPHRPCELCGEVGELRPYGPNGENICFSCGMKDRATTEAQFFKTMKIE